MQFKDWLVKNEGVDYGEPPRETPARRFLKTTMDQSGQKTPGGLMGQRDDDLIVGYMKKAKKQQKKD